MILTWFAFLFVIAILLRRAQHKGTNLCFVSFISFLLVFILYYIISPLFDLTDNEYYILCIFRGALISSLILFFTLRDKNLSNLVLWFFFLFITWATMLLDFSRLEEIISYDLHINLGGLSTIIELILINMNFKDARGTGFLNVIKSRYGFFHSNWSFKHLFINTRTFMYSGSSRLLHEKSLSAIKESGKVE